MGLEEAQGFRDKPQHMEKPCHGEKLGLSEKPGVKPVLEKPGLCPSFELGGCVTRGTQEAPGNGCIKGNKTYYFSRITATATAHCWCV